MVGCVVVVHQGDVPSEYVLASMLPLLCQDGRVLEAVSLLRRSVDSGKETRLRGFHPVLSALGHDGNIDLFVEVRAARSLVPVSPCVVSF